MPVYLVTPLSADTTTLNAAIQNAIGETDRYLLQAGHGWLVKYPGTTLELSNHLGITGQPKGITAMVGSALIVPITSYYGRGPTDMWEWLHIRMES